MAKKHEQKFDGMVLLYSLPGVGDATTDIAAWPENVKAEALKFAAKTLARNATAGLMGSDEDKKTALERVVTRFKNFAEGIWRSGAGAESAERPTSMLARAMAEALQIEAAEAAERIAALIDAKVAEAELSPDEEDDKTEIRKIAKAVRDFIASTKEVQPILLRIRAEEAVKRSQVATKADAPSLADAVKR